MSNSPKIKTFTDFDLIYNNPDPRPYYRNLAPVDYRMPEVTCGFLKKHSQLLARYFGRPKIRVLDFASGFGANGALLQHELGIGDLYSFYDKEAPGELPSCDEPFFSARQKEQNLFEIGGLDIAANALSYAKANGLIAEGFAENLIENQPTERLHAFLQQTDIIMEVGALLDILQEAVIELLKCATPGRRPWLLTSPRYDVDIAPLKAYLAQNCYVLETVNAAPIHYRKLISKQEQDLVAERIRELGRNPVDGFEGETFVVDLLLARPEADAKALPLAMLAFG